ncbi:MAG: hypothetical protein GY854_07530, partial [Deltaproteobacteria bacterium]|nr:hypothetical protein [Deltaproteobacteria bacterium]
CPDADSDKDDEASTFHKTTTPNPKQQRALDLLRGITVTTDVDSACPVLGATDNATSQAIGTLTLGASPAIAWESCTFPDGYNSNNTSYTPDVVGAGDGCLAPLKSTGNVHCLDESAIATCGSGGLADGDNAQDETCEQALNELVFSGDLNTFTMSFALVPNRASSRTYLSLGGTLASKVCD